MPAKTLRRIVGRVLRSRWAPRSLSRAWRPLPAAPVPVAVPVPVPAGPPALPPELPELEALATRDLWFFEHFIKVPRIVATELVDLLPLAESKILDFGCGEGLMAKGLARFVREVHGVDVMPDFVGLEDRFDKMFGPGNGFPKVSLKRVRADECLAFETGTFDGVFAWSVFEHVADVPFALGEIHRVIRPGGAFFLQIAPLYYSPHGGHLRHILDEPWIHLKVSQDELFKRLRTGNFANVPAAHRDAGFDERSSDDVCDMIINGFHSLNRITVKELTEHVQKAGFKIHGLLTTQDSPYEIPPGLLELYSPEDLLNEQVVIVMTR
jgi:SAM-dependent methyltransferase